MSRWRVILLIVLAAAPFVFLAGMGSYHLWERRWSFWAWWPMAACWALAYGLAWYWQRQWKLLKAPDFGTPVHWTDRDREAWQLVEARARAAAKIEPAKLTELQLYVTTAQEMALELAHAYRPGVRDPLGGLTIPEILAVVELATHDLAEMVDQYLPGSNLLTIDHWRRAKQAADWYQTANNVYWMISAVFSPIQTALKYSASQMGMSRPWQVLQQNLQVWFYTAYVHRLGTYLIEVNSGRLRVGAQRYRQLLENRSVLPTVQAVPEADLITITVLGQVKAGKSSLINALLGEQRARTDVLPMTDEITSYELHPEGIATRFVLLDTVGYGHEGPKADQRKATQQAAQQSDLLLLVMHARNPARQADLEMLQALRDWIVANPHLKLPPILGVLTHIDLLSPAMEWKPPYNWQQPVRPKEQQILQAQVAVRDQFESFLVGCVPVCTAPGRVHGIEEWLLPTLVELLDEAHAVAMLRCLRAESDTGKVRKVFEQLLAAGMEMLKHVGPPPDGKPQKGSIDSAAPHP